MLETQRSLGKLRKNKKYYKGKKEKVTTRA
jgi:hypothetical protein